LFGVRTQNTAKFPAKFKRKIAFETILSNMFVVNITYECKYTFLRGVK